MYIPEIEIKSQEEIFERQDELFKAQLLYLATHSPYYSELFKARKIDISSIGLQDLGKLPITSKDIIQLRNKDFYCVDTEKIIDYSTTSGTLGSPVVFILTEKDLDRLAYNEYASLSCAEISEKDIIQLTTTIDRCFMAGMAYFLGARKLGAGIIRVGSGLPGLQWDMISKINPSVLIAVPSFVLKMIDYAEELGIDYKKSSIQKIICVGEAIRDANFELNKLGGKITELWNVKLFSTYASTEMSTAFTECGHGIGGHHHPELVITEILDDFDVPVSYGEYGELTITTLGVEGMPLLRYKTGDICKAFSEPCPCGRKTMRISPILGRKNQMIKYKGTTLYPNALLEVFAGLSYVKRYVTEVFTNSIGTDEMIIHLYSDVTTLEIEKEIKQHLQSKLRVSPLIRFCSENELNKLLPTKFSRKPVDLIDRR